MPKQVIFSDGIRPGGDLTELDVTSEPKLPLRRSSRITKRVGTPPGKYCCSCRVKTAHYRRPMYYKLQRSMFAASMATNRRLLNPDTRSFIPSGADLPPLVNRVQGECIFSELEKPVTIESEPVKFAINRNLFVAVKRLIRTFRKSNSLLTITLGRKTKSIYLVAFYCSGLLCSQRCLVYYYRRHVVRRTRRISFHFRSQRRRKTSAQRYIFYNQRTLSGSFER